MRVADLDARPDRLMLDTNVLLTATGEGRAEHGDALNRPRFMPARNIYVTFR